MNTTNGSLEYTWIPLLMNLSFSIHASKGIPFCSQRAYHKCGHQELLRLYFNEMLYTVTHGKHYHALGHMDYILRYHPYSLEEFLGYEAEIKLILEQLIRHQAALEINSKGFRSLNRPHPPIEILKWYQEMGGTLLVIGSDAHKSSQMEKTSRVDRMVKTSGFSYYRLYGKEIGKKYSYREGIQTFNSIFNNGIMCWK